MKTNLPENWRRILTCVAASLALVGWMGYSGDVSGLGITHPGCRTFSPIRGNMDDILDDAIEQFNEEAQDSWIGREQPPLTREEVLEALESAVDDPDRTAEQIELIQKVVTDRELPDEFSLRRFTRYDDGQQFHEVWWIWLIMESGDGCKNVVRIRETSIFSRPFTQLERQNNFTGSRILLGRLTAYFESDPRGGQKGVISEGAASELITQFKSSIETDNFDQLLNLCHRDDVADSIQEFAISELRSLLNAEIKSVSVTPLQFSEELKHWQAFQEYEPNIPIDGYLEVAYIPLADKPWIRTTTSFEVGTINGQLKMIGYIPAARSKLPTHLGDGISISGGFVSDGNYILTYETITNPGPLVSGRLAHEEISRRALNPEGGTVMQLPPGSWIGKPDDDLGQSIQD